MGDAVRTHSLYLLKALHFVLVLTNTTLLEIHTLVSEMICWLGFKILQEKKAE